MPMEMINEAKQTMPTESSQVVDPGQKPLVNLDGLEPPESLEEVRIEEMTIDGICGVY